MRRSALAFLFCLTSSIANAQNSIQIEKPVICMPTAKLLEDLASKYNETPISVGKHGILDGVATVIYANLENGSYTVIEIDKTIGCVLSIGTDFKFKLPVKKTAKL